MEPVRSAKLIVTDFIQLMPMVAHDANGSSPEPSTAMKSSSYSHYTPIEPKTYNHTENSSPDL